jgi:acetolactate synthase-1/2/3 large subunit
VSDWLHQSRQADEVAGDGARAVAAAHDAPGRIATLVVPADCAWGEAAGPAAPLPGPITRPVDTARIEAVAAALKNGKRSMLILRGRCLEAAGMMAAGRIAAKTGARIAHEYFTPRITRGAGLPHIERIPYFGEEIAERLSGLEQIILVGAPPPVTFFAYPRRTGWVTPDGCALITLAQAQDDGAAALAALADVLDAHQDAPPVTLIRPAMPAPGALTSAAMGAIMARLMPDDCILSDDSLTAGPGIQAALKTGPRHDALFLTGGAIGDALPMAVGAALACPPRKVIAATGDGAAMYSLPALWTMARERLDVTVIVCANRSYNILNIELARVGARAAGNAQPGPRTLSMLDLRDPVIDFVKQAEGMGVEAGRAETTQDFAAQFAEAMSRPGPRLIEAVLQT